MRLIHWCVIVAAHVVCGLVFGLCIGRALAELSSDYVVVAADYTSLGWRAGLLLGTMQAAAHLIRDNPASGFSAIRNGLLVSHLVAAGLLCLILLIAAASTSLVDAGGESGYIAHPRRYALFVAIHNSWLYALAFGTAVSIYKCMLPSLLPAKWFK